MLVEQFKFKRVRDIDGFEWIAESEMEVDGGHRVFTAVANTLADVKEFAALVRWCERTGVAGTFVGNAPPGFESRMQTTWGGVWYPHRRRL